MMKKVFLAAMLLGGMLAGCTNKEQAKTEENMTTLNLTQEWDKVFQLSDKVNHSKVTFQTQYGLTLAADLYEPKEEVVETVVEKPVKKRGRKPSTTK